MFIKKVELENYRCYSKHTETFIDGLNIIANANGTGKTSIVEAISFALFGNKLTRGKANDWVKRGCKHGKVYLYLDDHVILRGDNEQYVTDSSGTIVARQHVGVDEWVANTYGLDADLYSTANYIAQKDIESFSGLQAAERIKRVEKLLKIDVLDSIKKEVKDKAKILSKNITSWKKELDKGSYDRDNLDSLIEDKEKYELELSTIESDYKEALIAKGEYNSKLSNWNKKLEIEKLQKEIIHFKINYDKSQLSSFQVHHSENKSVLKKLESLEEIIEKDTTELLSNLRDEYITIKTEYESIKDIKETCPTCLQHIPDVKDIVSKAADLKIKLSSLEQKGKEYTDQLEKYNLLNSLHEIKLTETEIKEMLVDLPKVNKVKQNEALLTLTEPTKPDVDNIEQQYSTVKGTINTLSAKIAKENLSKEIHEAFNDLYENAKKDLDISNSFVKFIDQYRKEFSQNVIPLINKNASTIFKFLTDNKYSKLTINKDYSIDDYWMFSGSEADCASFALRMAIAQINKIGSFDTIILDEVASSFDNEKEQLLVEILKNVTSQCIYISHGDIK